MRRALVLGDEIARHPFLKTLPAHVRHGGVLHPLRMAPARESLAHALWHRLRRLARLTDQLTAQDLREFLMAYCACFLAVSAFIG